MKILTGINEIITIFSAELTAAIRFNWMINCAACNIQLKIKGRRMKKKFFFFKQTIENGRVFIPARTTKLTAMGIPFRWYNDVTLRFFFLFFSEFTVASVKRNIIRIAPFYPPLY